jgi:hypothetical protein
MSKETENKMSTTEKVLWIAGASAVTFAATYGLCWLGVKAGEAIAKAATGIEIDGDNILLHVKEGILVSNINDTDAVTGKSVFTLNK